jgi:murein L,D-transpeptidase YcbB/YkuD
MRSVRLSTLALLIWATQASAQEPGLPPIHVAPLPEPDIAFPAEAPARSPVLVAQPDLQPPQDILITQSSVAIALEPLPEPVDPAIGLVAAHAPLPVPPRLDLPEVEAPPKVAIIPPAAVPQPEIAVPGGTVTDEWRKIFDRSLPAIASAAPHLDRPQLEAIRIFYEGREGRALFTAQGQLSPAGQAVLSIVAKAEEHGLSPQRFERLASLSAGGSAEGAEFALAALAFSYARDARGARLDPANVSRLITARPSLPEVQAVLAGLAGSATPAVALEAWNPQHPGYRMLKARLAEVRSQDHTGSTARPVTGVAGDLIANMERWRWLPTELGTSHVFVNVPSYRLELNRDGRMVFETRVIVGKPNSPTPIFSHAMEFLVVNPFWNVPPSIALKEYLPLLKSNPYALQARGLQVVSRGRVVDPATIDWSRLPRSVAIRQPPGERNALGHIKFMFPNEHAVYLHDTPSRGLFSAARRAFSHGCVRVQNPFALASAMSGWSESWLRGMVGGAERRLDLKDEVQVHLAYFTLEAQDDGSLATREDIYGHHRRMKRLMGLP